MDQTRMFAALLLLLVGSLLPAAGEGTLLYQIDFSSDALGSRPAFDLGPFPRTGPSDPLPSFPADLDPGTVVASAGPLNDKPLLFDHTGILPFPNNDFQQLHLDLPGLNTFQPDPTCVLSGGTEQECRFDPLSSHYEIAFDLTVLELAPDSGFGLLLDTPAFRALTFGADGGILVNVPNGPNPGPVQIGSYELGELLQVGVEVDLIASEWATSINGTELYRDSFGNAFNVHALRFGLGTGSPGRVAIDNISVAAIPEPQTGALLSLGIAALAGLRRYRAHA